ncbi:MAG: HI0074 family nucleotidyltransferase substrate-binding subunit [Chromatiales bacterium]
MGQHRDRFEVSRRQFAVALDRLREVAELDETDIIRDSLIQRFEFCYELAWKTMRHYLRDEGVTLPEVPGVVFQSAFAAHLIQSAQAWEKIKDCRNETSHTYDRDKAVEVAAFVRSSALPAFIVLLDKLASL